MKSVTSYDDLRMELAKLTQPIGFVPTMGYLHAGHLSLVKRAKQDNKSVVVSIFANPTQFSPDEDLENYPRDIESDLAQLMGEAVDLVWTPSVDTMYPAGFQTWVEVEDLTKKLEGKLRPTHFRGVTTIVSKLFNAVQPDRAYFGQKDAQQAVVISQMARDLNYPTEIIICPTVREPDGLAMSSRNSYLNDEERQAALCLFRSLTKAKDAFLDGRTNAEKLKELVTTEIYKEKLAELQYVSCANPESLDELTGDIERCLLCLAVFIGKTRLIDNLILTSGDNSY